MLAPDCFGSFLCDLIFFWLNLFWYPEDWKNLKTVYFLQVRTIPILFQFGCVLFVEYFIVITVWFFLNNFWSSNWNFLFVLYSSSFRFEVLKNFYAYIFLRLKRKIISDWFVCLFWTSDLLFGWGRVALVKIWKSRISSFLFLVRFLSSKLYFWFSLTLSIL